MELSYELIEHLKIFTINIYIHPSEYIQYISNFECSNQEIKRRVLNSFPSLEIVTINVICGTDLLSTFSLAKSVSNENFSDNLILVNKSNNLENNYKPDDLIVPNVQFPFEEYQEKKLLKTEAALALESMFQKAIESNIDLYAISGFRSFDRQKVIYENNVAKYGEKSANQFSARPGQSEHQTGLAMDISAKSVGLQLKEEFGETIEGKWVEENAGDFGFIIRYPKGKEEITGYQYEPWHLRYVGVDAAKYISENDLTLEEFTELIK